jgi:hypothetical protein
VISRTDKKAGPESGPASWSRNARGREKYRVFANAAYPLSAYPFSGYIPIAAFRLQRAGYSVPA